LIGFAIKGQRGRRFSKKKSKKGEGNTEENNKVREKKIAEETGRIIPQSSFLVRLIPYYKM
jgi:hypothetical protein